MASTLYLFATQEEIHSRIKEIAKEISDKYRKSDNLLLIGIMNGSLMFFSDLLREIRLPFDIEFDTIKIKSYNDKNKDKIQFDDAQLKNIEDYLYENNKSRNIIIVDDILDTGETLKFIIDKIKNMNCDFIESCVLLYRKDGKRKISPDYRCFDILNNNFAIGYGMDINRNRGAYKNLYELVEINNG